MNTSTFNLNQNVADCLKSISDIGKTVYQNVCNGTQSIVPWGTADWFMAICAAILAILLITMFSWMLHDIRTDTKWPTYH